MKYKNIIPTIISIIISFACLYLFYREVNSFNDFFKQIQSANYLYILVATLLLCFTVLIRALRWNVLLGSNKNIYTLFKIQMIGYFGNNILPFRAGEILKSFLLGEKEQISKSYALGTIIIERFLDMLMLLFFTIVCIFVSPVSKIDGIPIYYLLIVILGAIGLFLLCFVIISKIFIKVRLIQNFIDKLTSAYRELSFRHFIHVNFYGVLIWLIYWINVELIFKAFNLSVDPYQSLIILIVASIINSIPSLPGALGTFHLGVGITIAAMDVMNNNSLESFTTVLHLYGYISLTFIGLYYFIIDKTIGIRKINIFRKD